MLPRANSILFLIVNVSFCKYARIISGNSRFAAQSPPPMTFPALTEVSLSALAWKNDFLYDVVTISAQALLAL